MEGSDTRNRQNNHGELLTNGVHIHGLEGVLMGRLFSLKQCNCATVDMGKGQGSGGEASTPPVLILRL